LSTVNYKSLTVNFKSSTVNEIYPCIRESSCIFLKTAKKYLKIPLQNPVSGGIIPMLIGKVGKERGAPLSFLLDSERKT